MEFSESFLVSFTFVHVTFDNIEIRRVGETEFSLGKDEKA